MCVCVCEGTFVKYILHDIVSRAILSIFHKHHPANLPVMKPSIKYVVIKVIMSEQS